MLQVDRRSGAGGITLGIESARSSLTSGHDLAQPAGDGRAVLNAAAAQADRGIGLDLVALLGWGYMALFVGAVAFRALRA